MSQPNGTANAGADTGTRAHQWKPGQSGNPSGKARGTRNRATALAEQMIGDDAERIVRSVIDKALQGDTTCLRLCLERLAPPLKDRPIDLHLPDLDGVASCTQAFGALVGAVTYGELLPSEASAIASLLDAYRRAAESEELEKRVAALEALAPRARK